jgi:3-mercaptopyruvate sulfurtransferase SseA
MAKKRNSSNNGPLILIGAGIFLIVAFALYQVFSTNPASTLSSTPANPNLPFATIERVKLADARAALDQKKALFVDVRDADVYKTSHITGALNIPLGETQARLREIDPNQWIILYCT